VQNHWVLTPETLSALAGALAIGRVPEKSVKLTPDGNRT